MSEVRSSSVRVFVVDRHPVFREGIISALASEEGIAFAGQAGRLVEMFEHLVSVAPTVAIVDGGMLHGGCFPGFYERCDALGARVLVVAPPWSAPFVSLLAEGMIGSCILRTARNDELVDAVRRSAGGDCVRCPLVAEYLSVAMPNVLTARDLAVLSLVAEGMANASIASELRVSLSCVNKQMRIIRGKLNARDRTHAVTLGLKHGFLDIG